MSVPLVYVVILNWNKYHDTSECLQSLAEASYPNLKTIVVDNGSADGSGKSLADDFPDVRFIFNDQNLGFSRACNIGMRAALDGQECRDLLLLNNDALVSPGFLEKPIQTAESRMDIGMVGGKIFHSPDSNVLAYAGGRVSRWRGQIIPRGMSEVDEGKYDEPLEIGYIIGALMLIKREVLEKVGLLPEEYFFGIEDLDYSLTVQQKGYKLYYVPEFLAYHLGDGSHWNWDPKYVYNSYRGKLILLQKHLPPGLFPIWKILLKVYAKYVARRRWQALARKYDWDKDKIVLYADMEFAVLKAIQDHNKDELSEQTLIRFDEDLKKKRMVSVS